MLILFLSLFLFLFLITYVLNYIQVGQVRRGQGEEGGRAEAGTDARHQVTPSQLHQQGGRERLPRLPVGGLDQRHDIQGREGGEENRLNLPFQDQDDCSKRLLCELNAKKAGGETITDNEKIIAASYGKTDSIDINAESLEFDIAAVLGRVVRVPCGNISN